MTPHDLTAGAAVVIVNLNGRDVLERCLTDLGRQTVRPRRVIVVDNASTDGSADGIEDRHPGVEVVRSPTNLGFAAANNLGVSRAADCEWIALLNPDAYPEPRWLEALLDAAARTGATALGSRLVQADAPERLDGTGDVLHVSGLAWRRQHGRPVAEAPANLEEVFAPCAAAALYRRDAWLAVGGMEERYFCYFEDVDLAFRLRLAGGRCVYVPGSVAHHVGSVLTGRESDFTIYHSHRNLVWTYVRNMPPRSVWLHLPEHLAVNLLTIVWFSLRGQAGTILRAKRDALRGLPWALRGRRAIQGRRTATRRDVMRTLTGGIGVYTTAFGRAVSIARAGAKAKRAAG